MLRIVFLILAAGLVFAAARWLLVDDGPAPARPPAPAAVERFGASPATDRSASTYAASPSFPVPAPPSAPDRGSVPAVYEVPPSSAPVSVPPAAQPATQAVIVPPASGQGAVPGMMSAEPLPPEGASESESAEKDRGWISMRGTYAYNLPAQAGGGKGQVNVATTIDCNNGAGVLYYRDPRQRVEWKSSPLAFEANSVCLEDKQAFQAIANTFNAVFSGSYLPQRADVPAGVPGAGQFGVRFVSTDGAGRPLPFVEFCLGLQGGPYGEYALPESASKRAPAPGCVLLDNFWVKRMNKEERR